MIWNRRSIFATSKFYFWVNCDSTKCIYNRDAACEINLYIIINVNAIQILESIHRSFYTIVSGMCKFVVTFSSIRTGNLNVRISWGCNKKNLLGFWIINGNYIDITKCIIRECWIGTIFTWNTGNIYYKWFFLYINVGFLDSNKLFIFILLNNLNLGIKIFILWGNNLKHGIIHNNCLNLCIIIKGSYKVIPWFVFCKF